MSERVPEGWKLLPLGDVANIFSGGTPSRSDISNYIGEIPWVKSGEVNQRKVYSTEEKISDQALKSSSAKWVKNGSVLVAMYGATAGKVAKLLIDATINQAIAAVCCDSEETSNDFLFHEVEFKSLKLLDSVQGSGQPNLSGQLVKELKVSLPPLPEQKKIASILTSVDEVIETTQKQIGKLQDLKKATMNELLTKGIGHTEFKDSELGRIPKSWENRQFGQFCREKSVKFDGKSELPVLSVTKYDGFVSSLDYFKKQVFSRDLSSYKVVRKGQFAYATIHLDEGSLGLLSDYDGGLISPMYTVFETMEECNSKFLFFLMKSDLYMSKYPALGQGSINRRMSISFHSLSELNIATPPLAEQKKIAFILTSVDKTIEDKQRKLSQTQSLKKSLMQDLLTGKVRVQVN